MTTSRQLAEIAMAAMTGTVLLIRELGTQGVIDREAFARLLDKQADQLELNSPPNHDPQYARMDLKMLRRMAGMIREEPAGTGSNEPAARWTPTVFEGGKEN